MFKSKRIRGERRNRRKHAVDAAACGRSLSFRFLLQVFLQRHFPARRLDDQATDGGKLQSLVANQRADGVSDSAGTEKQRWRLFPLLQNDSARLEQKEQLASSRAEIIGEIWVMAAAHLIFLQRLQAANEENLATPPFLKTNMFSFCKRAAAMCERPARFHYFNCSSSSSSLLQQLLKKGANHGESSGTRSLRRSRNTFTVGAAAALMWISESWQSVSSLLLLLLLSAPYRIPIQTAAIWRGTGRTRRSPLVVETQPEEKDCDWVHISTCTQLFSAPH